MKISRRSVLMGGGAMMALPLLEAFQSKRAIAAGTSDPRRLVLIHFPNGTQTRAANPTWFSAPDGATLSAANAPIPLQPFTGNLGDISVLKYLTQTALYNNLVAGTGDHQTSHLFTGQSGTKLADSFDVAYAKKTPQNRIVYLANSTQSGGGSSLIELAQNAGANVVPELSPISLYNTYFKNLTATTGTAAPPIDIVRNPAILNVPNAALADLSSKLGKQDQATLASFVQGLTDLKTNLTSTAPVAAGCTPIGSPTAASSTANCVSGTDYFNRMMAFNSLIATAFQCDLFRSVSISFGCETGASNFMSYGGGSATSPVVGNYPSSLVYSGGAVGDIQDHSISHQIDNAENSGSINPMGFQINMTRDRLHMYLVVDLINKLKAISDPSGSKVLDNTCIFGAFSTYDGEHDPGATLGQPAIVAGGKNFMSPGRSINASTYDVNDIYYTFNTFLAMGLANWYPAKQIALPYGQTTGRTVGSTLVPL
jgi:Protein of unknown function (DUF1552)